MKKLPKIGTALMRAMLNFPKEKGYKQTFLLAINIEKYSLVY